MLFSKAEESVNTNQTMIQPNGQYRTYWLKRNLKFTVMLSANPADSSVSVGRTITCVDDGFSLPAVVTD